jgi:hypothetical protein
MTSSPYAVGIRSMTANTALAVGLLLLTTACGSSFQTPTTIDDGSLRERAVIKTEDNIRVSAAVPSADEARSTFGIDLGEQGVQPLWLEIENGTERPFVFLPTGLDPEYFAPQEVSFLYKDTLTEEGYTALTKHIQDLSFDSRKMMYPGETVSGFVYLNQLDTTLVAEITLIGRNWSDRIGLLVPMPGAVEGWRGVESARELYTEGDFVDIESEVMLRSALEGLPCCATEEYGAGEILPLNLVLIGEVEKLGAAFVGRGYRYGSSSPLYAFGRQQDLSGHKTSRWVAPQPHVLRFWLTPLRYQGKPIWVGQVSGRLGGRFAAPAEGIWRTEPDVDEARNDLVQDLFYSQRMSKIGFVKGAGRVDARRQDEATDGFRYHTDGLRAVIDFGGKDVSLAQVDFFDWERLIDHYRQQIE